MTIKELIFCFADEKIPAHIQQNPNGCFQAYAATIGDGTLYAVGKEQSKFETALTELVRIILEQFEKKSENSGNEGNNTIVKIFDLSPDTFLSIENERLLLVAKKIQVIIEAH